MGRLRTTGCTSRHWPGEPCKLCARVRARKSRAALRAKREAQVQQNKGREREDRKRGLPPPVEPTPKITRTPERLARDEAAKAHRAIATRARTYVAKYRKRGALIVPAACEHCNRTAITPGTQQRAPMLYAWHPDPTEKKQIAWLCKPCRNYARHSGELIALRWDWPGTALPMPIGRPRHVAVDADWIRTAEAAAQRTKMAELANALFFSIFSKVAGSKAHLLFRAARRAVVTGKQWCPTGDPTLDARLRAWASFEYESLQNKALADRERVAEPPVQWERRERIDRTLRFPPEPTKLTAPAAFDQAEYERKVAVALDKLTAAEAVADALLARLAREYQ